MVFAIQKLIHTQWVSVIVAKTITTPTNEGVWMLWPQRSIGAVCFNNPTRHGKMKTAHSQGLLFEKKAALRLPKSPYGARVSEMVCMLILYLSAQTSCTWLFLPAPSTSFLFAFRSQITSSHFHLFPFLLLLYILKHCHHFNVNSVFAHVPLNPPSFCTAFAQIPEKLKRETCICLWGLPHNMSFAAS